MEVFDVELANDSLNVKLSEGEHYAELMVWGVSIPTEHTRELCLALLRGDSKAVSSEFAKAVQKSVRTCRLLLTFGKVGCLFYAYGIEAFFNILIRERYPFAAEYVDMCPESLTLEFAFRLYRALKREVLLWPAILLLGESELERAKTRLRTIIYKEVKRWQ